jgi:16S rRNA (guanine966-N2)-methyltransferase
MNSKLQIISGRYKGRKLALPPDARPTQAKARIAIFNVLGAILDWRDGMKVWDAFAGSGEFGIEIISRYPGVSVLFSDIADSSVATIKKNLAGMETTASVIKADAMAMVGQVVPTADLIFVDPPYSCAGFGHKFIEKISKVARPGTVVVWEQDADDSVVPGVENWEILQDKQYGRARFLFMVKK